MERPQSILIIRFSSLGDVVLTSPVIRILALQKKAKISVLVKSDYAEVFSNNPYVSQVYEWSSKEESKNLISQLQVAYFDMVVDLQNSFRSRNITKHLTAKKLVLHKRVFKKTLLVFMGVNRYDGTHIVEDYFACIEELGVRDDGKGLNYFLNSNFEPKDVIGKKNICIAVGGTYITKRIPINLVNEIVRDQEFSYTLIGGRDVGTQYESLLNENVLNVVGKFSISESAALIHQSSIVITGDTGMMHIAAAFQKPIIVIWGSTDESIGFYPYYGKHSNQRFISIKNPDLSCQPCSKYGRSKCPKGHMNCLTKLKMAQVKEAIQLLQR